MLIRRVSLLASISLLLAGIAFASEAIPNWAAPPTWSPPRAHGALGVQDVTNPMPFIGLAPCRLVDTRGTAGVPINTGGSFSANQVRTWTFTGLCGLPSIVAAVSLNITVTNTGGQTGFGFVKVWPGGSTEPNVSTLNWSTAGVTESNAAIVPLSDTGTISLRSANNSSDVIVDINGYYSPYPLNSSAVFQIFSISGTAAIVGETGSTAYEASGVYGHANRVSGRTFGVWGETDSNDYGSAGVWGTDSRYTPFVNPEHLPAGVRGDSVSNYGVLGVSSAYGVAGSLVNDIGTQLAYGILGVTGGTVYGVYSGGAIGATGVKYFIEPHPTDASKVIRYVSLEGPESGTYFRGRGKFQDGLATIDVPEDFRMVTDSAGLSIQVTPIGEFANIAVLRIELDGIVVKASRNVEFFYTVNGVRRTQKDLKPIGPGEEFMPRNAEARMPAYLTEGQKQMLISNGTYNADGTVNMETAERLGWVKAWADQKAQAKAAAAARAAMIGERK